MLLLCSQTRYLSTKLDLCQLRLQVDLLGADSTVDHRDVRLIRVLELYFAAVGLQCFGAPSGGAEAEIHQGHERMGYPARIVDLELLQQVPVGLGESVAHPTVAGGETVLVLQRSALEQVVTARGGVLRELGQ